jgi:excisionase family DNA binding protein
MQPTAESFEPLITAAQAGQLLGLHPVTLLRWAREYRVPCHRIGRKVKFRTSELNAWLASGYTKRAVRAA